MKGLILCAGRGTRLRPLTYSQPKPLLPVANKPVLVYALEQLARTGIEEIGIVINPFQEGIIRHHIRMAKPRNVSVTMIHQERPRGIADAVRQAEDFIGQDRFLLLLGDNLIQQSLNGLKQDIRQSGRNGSILLARVNNPREYGIASIEGDRIVRLEEKPISPRSNLAVIGAYAFDSRIFTAIHQISPSARGEYEITDAIQWMIDHEGSISYSLTDQHYSDVGTVSRWLEANHWKLNELSAGRSMIDPTSTVKDCTIIDPVIIGEGCTLVESTIGPYVSMEAGVKVDRCRIRNSILLEKAQLERISTPIDRSVFGRHVRVGCPASDEASGRFILGDGSSIYLHPGELGSGKQ
ncbi:glucose-1-phosphate thymidylyltransferase [Melghirimyces profundicolus]|uniref:Glucose-1-phosphate thymidylyltransferase n=1 Tax=Melghirimyces profundicolus TaxID=1242148 RepID=A0A2T6AY19_9BACL|nr:glucose-1-phosphate thymidylyltransferase [Melghirimyces profundicolus]PTX48715.1 glucose-1-phosphate thymidylyltransferase [Melghirimyces profundicolus]